MTERSASNAASLPLVSVVIEGYNQGRDLGVADATIKRLAAQDYPTSRVELVLVGSPPQIADWQARYADGHGFRAIKYLSFDEMRYYDFKNAGTTVAAGEIVAMTDSDVLPRRRWISAIVETITGGADASMGPSLFGDGVTYHADSVLMRMTASITWGWILGPPDPETGRPRSRGFHDHNIAMRADVWRDHKYRTDLGRIMSSPLLFHDLLRDGKRVRFHPHQQAEHQFSLRYWLISLQYRYGHEVYRLRRADRNYPNQWITRTGIFEPLVTYGWHVMLDVPKWFRLNRALGKNVVITTALLPAFVLVSAFARSFEMAGMIWTMVRPQESRRWAESI
ncbi:MAG: glycosyltransferase [Sphingomonadaceae bacterium]